MKIQVRTCDGCCVEERAPREVMAEKHFLPERACTVLERARADGSWVEERFILVYWDGTYMVRHRLRAPLPPDSPRLLRGRLSRPVLDALYAFLRQGRSETAFVVDAGSRPLPAAVAAVAREVPKTR